jgi:hypothetical protein
LGNPNVPNELFLNKTLYITVKEDGCNVCIWNDEGKIRISSRDRIDATEDIAKRVIAIIEYPFILQILKRHPSYLIYCEFCRAGSSITGNTFYLRDKLYIFDIFDFNTGLFKCYDSIVDIALHFDVTFSFVWMKSYIESLDDLEKLREKILDYCVCNEHEGMVIKLNPETWSYGEYYYIQAKVKRSKKPRAKLHRSQKDVDLSKEEITEADLLGAIDKAYQELGESNFKLKQLAMPLVAKKVMEECKAHNYRCSLNLFKFYMDYCDRLIKKGV